MRRNIQPNKANIPVGEGYIVFYGVGVGVANKLNEINFPIF